VSAGRVCVVTGATSGIGLATATELARRGTAVVVVGRNAERTAAAVERIRETTGVAVEPIVADLTIQADVRALAAEIQRRHSRVDVLLNNAGALFAKRELTPDGVERTLALNHLSPFLLTNLLLDALKASAPSRIVTVSSGMHRRGRIDFDDLQAPRRHDGWRAYSQSKLANLLFTYELARRLEGSGVTANAVLPGFVATRIARPSAGSRMLLRLFAPFALTPEEGAETVVWLASSSDVERLTGSCFKRKEPIRTSPASYDEAVARRLWKISTEMTSMT
jgi:NAD(P)-dependent dehydrogenase (short-subunit alcohol dehydrogenase family)